MVDGVYHRCKKISTPKTRAKGVCLKPGKVTQNAFDSAKVQSSRRFSERAVVPANFRRGLWGTVCDDVIGTKTDTQAQGQHHACDYDG
jgi:hypothetical protein